MSTRAVSTEIEYPDSDGKPLADNTLQFEWITKLVGGLDAAFRADPNVFVAGDLLWYPVEGKNTISAAPDAMVVFGRPKGYRGSYIQHREEGIAPQVVFEVLSPNNSAGEMAKKLEFYDRFQVEEYYLVDPMTPEIRGWNRQDGRLLEIEDPRHWVSPRLGIRFDQDADDLRVIGTDDQPFEGYLEVVQRAEEADRRADDERRRADDEGRRADDERRRADDEQRRTDRLREQLRSLGIDPDA